MAVKKEIDKDAFEKLCAIQCTAEEICFFMGVSDKTLYKWCNETYGDPFSATFKKLSSGGRISLRRAMYAKALEGNVPMMIWLSKQYLGMREYAAKDDREE